MLAKYPWRWLVLALLVFPGLAQAATFTSPLKGDVTLDTIFTNIVNALLTAAGVFAIGGIVFAGFKYITAFGDETKVGQAKKIIFYSIVGLTIIILSRVILQFVGYTILGVK